MGKRKWCKKGFTLIELMTVVIIVGILASAAVPIYRGQIKRAIAAEGEALLGSVRTAELIYYSENGNYLPVDEAEGGDPDNDPLGIDASKNKYFTSYSVSGTTATTRYTDDGENEYVITMNINNGEISRTYAGNAF